MALAACYRTFQRIPHPFPVERSTIVNDCLHPTFTLTDTEHPAALVGCLCGIITPYPTRVYMRPHRMPSGVLGSHLSHLNTARALPFGNHSNLSPLFAMVYIVDNFVTRHLEPSETISLYPATTYDLIQYCLK